MKKKLQNFYMKISIVYRRLTYVMHAVDTLARRQEDLQRSVAGMKEHQARMEQELGKAIELGVQNHAKQELIDRRIGVATDIESLPKAKGVLRDVQDISFEMLKTVDAICKKHKLQYWLDFGTLLGAVRHKGFVPWDDDMDISMMSDDYEKLLSVIDKELASTNFRFIHVPSQIGKIVHKDFMPVGEDEITSFINWDVRDKIVFALDISPYYYAKDSISDTELGKLVEKSTKEKIDTMFDGGLKYANFRRAAKVVDSLHKKIATKEQSNRVFMGLEVLAIRLATKPWIVNTDTLFPLTEVEFDGGVFPAPRSTELYLIDAYGDYMQLPSDVRSHTHTQSMPISELKKIRQAARTRVEK